MADSKLVKSAGEHWTCAVLARLGWAAALTRDGVERTDVLAAHPDGTHVSIQVKTTSTSSNPKFMFGVKGCDASTSHHEWFVLVALAADPWGAPRAFVVPRNHIAAAVWIRHMEWLTNPTVAPGKRNTPLANNRTDAWVFARYEQRWDLLHMSTESVPVMLPTRFKTWANDPRVMLPPKHPWSTQLPNWEESANHDDWPTWATLVDS